MTMELLIVLAYIWGFSIFCVLAWGTAVSNNTSRKEILEKELLLNVDATKELLRSERQHAYLFMIWLAGALVFFILFMLEVGK